MRKGIFINFGFEMDTRSRIDLIRKTGFDSVMVWFGAGDEKETVDYAREQGLYVSNAHLPFKNINRIWEDGEDGDAMTDNFCRLVRLCGELSVPVAVFHVSSTFTPPPFGELGIARISRVVKAAEECGVDIAFENLRRLDYLKYVYDNIPSKRAKFCFDCGHHNYLCPDADLFSMYGNRLVAIHLHDNFGDYDWHMLPFDGNVDFDMVTKGLHSIGYEGPISLEVHQDVHEMYKDYTAKRFVTEAYERAVRIEKMMNFASEDPTSSVTAYAVPTSPPSEGFRCGGLAQRQKS